MRIIKKISKSLTPKEQYLEKYGKHFTIKLADFASEQMVNSDGTNKHWDVTINVKDKQATYTIPEQLSVTRANNLVLAIDQKDLIQELETMKTNAKLIIDSVDTQKTILQKADKLLLELNPVLKEKQQNEQRFSKIEDSLSQIAKLMEKQQETINNFINDKSFSKKNC